MKRAATAIVLTVLVVVPLVAVGGGAAVVDLELTGPEEVSSHEEVAFEAAVDAGSEIDIESYRLAFVDRRTNRTINVTFGPAASSFTFPEYASYLNGVAVDPPQQIYMTEPEVADPDDLDVDGPIYQELDRMRTLAVIGSASVINTLFAESDDPVPGIGVPPGIRVLALAETLEITREDGGPGSGYGYGDDGAGYGDNGAGYGDNGAGYGDNGAGYGDNGAGYGDDDAGYGYDGDGYGYGDGTDGPATYHVEFHTAAFIPNRTYDLQLYATTTDGETFESNVATFNVTNSTG